MKWSRILYTQIIIVLQLLRCNVDLLKIIQLGLTFFNADGEMPEGVCTWQVSMMSSLFQLIWGFFLVNATFDYIRPELDDHFQFNFKFNLSEDMYAEDSVELLQNSGIQFDRHEREVFCRKGDSKIVLKSGWIFQGIETVHFAEMLLVSGTVLLDDVR